MRSLVGYGVLAIPLGTGRMGSVAYETIDPGIIVGRTVVGRCAH
jgi:hypothetical protein